MNLKSYAGKAVLVTGGTKGIGLATGLAFGRQGAHVYLTNRWGSADEDEVKAKFAAVGAPEPTIVEADVSQKKETKALLELIAKDHDRIEAFISGVTVVMRGDGTENHKERVLYKSMEYSSWPTVEYLKLMKKIFGKFPRYTVAMTSDGPDCHYPGYDWVAVSKSVLETFVRYMAVRLREDGATINTLRTRQVITESYVDMFGEEAATFARRFPEFIVTAEEVAATALALCSGLFEGLTGQLVVLDKGSGFVDNLMTLGQRLLDPVPVEDLPPLPGPAELVPRKAPAGDPVELPNDFQGKAVLITGGTSGIGLETGLAFGRLGAHAYLTQRWDLGYDLDAVRARFAEAGAPEPVIMDADVSLDEDTEALLEAIAEQHPDGPEVFVSNVAFGDVIRDFKELSFKRLKRTMGYSAWPMVRYLQLLKKRFGRYPRYVVGVSSNGHLKWYPGYEMVAAAKTVMEVFGRYLTADLLDEDIRINVVRGNPCKTPSFDSTFGLEMTPFCEKHYGPDYFIPREEFAAAVVGLASGLMDGIKGQVIALDHGVNFDDNIMRLFPGADQSALDV